MEPHDFVRAVGLVEDDDDFQRKVVHKNYWFKNFSQKYPQKQNIHFFQANAKELARPPSNGIHVLSRKPSTLLYGMNAMRMPMGRISQKTLLLRAVFHLFFFFLDSETQRHR